MALDCNSIAAEELKRLRDIQRLMQALVLVFRGSLDGLKLEEIL